jgi:hypothetical protein
VHVRLISSEQNVTSIEAAARSGGEIERLHGGVNFLERDRRWRVEEVR